MVTIRTFDCEKTGRLSVKLKANVDRAAFLAKHQIEPQYTFTLNTFAGMFDDATVDALRASSDVEWIEEDPIMHCCPIRDDDDKPQ